MARIESHDGSTETGGASNVAIRAARSAHEVCPSDEHAPGDAAVSAARVTIASRFLIREVCLAHEQSGGEDVAVWSPGPHQPNPSAIDEVVRILDPVLTPLGFATGQGGASEQQGQVIFCRGDIVSTDGGCVDLVMS